jgi:ankyrin repeat protein
MLTNEVKRSLSTIVVVYICNEVSLCVCEDDDGMTALFAAACNGHIEVVKYLASEAGADVNICDNQGTSPCDAAFSNGHVDLARYLREVFSAVSGEDSAAVNALEQSVESLKQEISTLKRELGGKRRQFAFFIVAIAVVILAYFNYSGKQLGNLS